MLSFELIQNASQGDIESLNQIIEQYSPYINQLSRKRIYCDDRTEYIVDVDLQDQLISKMIDLILNFTPIPKIDKEAVYENENELF
jgi:hypothetical protein